MTSDAVAEAARILVSARLAGAPVGALPPACRPHSDAEGYVIQSALLASGGGETVGFKVGATSEKAQSFIGTETPFFGQVLREGCHESPAELPAEAFAFRLIEPEFAFRLGEALPARAAPYERDEVAAAVDALYPAIEVVTSCLRDWNRQGTPSIIADNGAHGALVLGARCDNWRALDLETHKVVLQVNGKTTGEGTGADCLGHPLNALTWLVNALSAQGRDLAAGSLITTGVVTPFELLEAGDRARADFGSLGEVVVAFGAAS